MPWSWSDVTINPNITWEIYTVLCTVRSGSGAASLPLAE